MRLSFLKSKDRNLPLAGLLTVQLMIGIMMIPFNNFGGIYINEVLNFSLSQVSMVIALGQVMGMIAAITSGSLSDNWGHKWIMFGGIISIAIGSLLYLVQMPVIVIILWCIASAGMGLTSVSSQGYLTLVSRAEILGIASALYNWGYTIGGTIGIPIATMILSDDNYSRLGIAIAGFGVLTAIIISQLPLMRSEFPRKKSPDKFGGYGILRRKSIFMLSLLRFLPTCYYGVMTLFPILIKQQSGSNTVVAWFVAGSSIFASLTQLLAGWVADKFGVKLPTQISFITILVAIAGTIFTAETIWGLYIFGGLGIGAAWALSTLLPGMVTRVSEPEIRGRVFGMLHFIWTIAMALGTLLGGNLIAIDFRLPFVIVGVLNIIALLLTIPFFKLESPHTASES